MSKRNDQQGGTRAVLGGSRNKLDSITSKGKASDDESAQGPTAVEAKPTKRVRKTISISVDTVLAISRIQDHRLVNEGKQPTDSAIIDEAVMELLRSSNLSL